MEELVQKLKDYNTYLPNLPNIASIDIHGHNDENKYRALSWVAPAAIAYLKIKFHNKATFLWTGGKKEKAVRFTNVLLPRVYKSLFFFYPAYIAFDVLVRYMTLHKEQPETGRLNRYQSKEYMVDLLVWHLPATLLFPLFYGVKVSELLTKKIRMNTISRFTHKYLSFFLILGSIPVLQKGFDELADCVMNWTYRPYVSDYRTNSHETDPLSPVTEEVALVPPPSSTTTTTAAVSV